VASLVKEGRNEMDLSREYLTNSRAANKSYLVPIKG